ncbi:Scr1 family TA system antitoxin-like transcriptional regulator [Streptomyces sp. AC154]|uniref:Scr1 family TA system antitoxin-like transcriptional regulator n=1 Tax=Streptomyces sp. AC154 TaxID=3143184 RepID=UPI003F8154A3
MTSSVPWTDRLSAGTEATQDDVARWYRDTREGRAYVPTMIWGTLQTEAYATVILGQVVDFLGIPDDVPAGVAKRMQRQEVLYDGEHHYDVVLGEQALYTNIGGSEVMGQQIERLVRELDLSSLTLGILPSTARVDLFPVPGFNIYGDRDRVHVELVSSAVDITDQSELDLYSKAFAALSSAASYGDAAEELLKKAHAFWTNTPLRQ